MYSLRIPSSMDPQYTGRYMSIDFCDGIATVNKDYYRKVLMRYGCTDITEPEEVEEMKNRPISKVLFIRFGAFGDNLIVTPAIKAFKLKHDAIVHVVARPPSNQIFVNEYVDALIACRPSDVGHLIDDYDEVIDFTHSIEHNAEADWRDAVEIACDWVNAHPEDGDYRPVFNPNDMERTIAAGILADHGIDTDTDTIVVLHGESTSGLRTLPEHVTAEVARKLAYAGYKVLMPGMRDFSSYFQGIPREIANNIVSLRIEMLHEVVSSKIILATVSFADLVIAVDSAHSHLAAALDKPSLLIYGPFDPATRAKHYPKAKVLYRPLPCGPCQTLGRFCPRHPGTAAPCMIQYTAEEIFDMSIDILEDRLIPTGVESIEPYKPEDVRNCPVCGHDKVLAFTRKGEFFYVKCQQCDTYYTHKILDKPIDVNEEGYGPEEKHIEHYAKIIQQVADAHDIKGRTLAVHGPWRITFKVGSILHKDGWYDPKLDSETDMIASLFNFEMKEYPADYMAFVTSELADDGIILIYGPSNEACVSNAWPPMNPPIAGAHRQLMGRKAYQYLADKNDLEIIKYDRIGDNALITLRKRLNKNVEVSR